MEHATPAVNVENARVYLGGHEILHNISWQVQRGERCFILGANGAGKTTLVKVLMGFAWPLFGARVQVLGKTFGHVNLLELRKSIAWVSPFMHKWLEDGSWNGRDMVLSDAGRGGKSRRNHEIPESGAFDRQTGGSHVFRGTGESADCPGSDDESGTDDSGRTQRLSGFGRAGIFIENH